MTGSGALLVAVALSAVLPAGVPVLVAALVALVGLREPREPEHVTPVEESAG